jgi:hypothetical protein
VKPENKGLIKFLGVFFMAVVLFAVVVATVAAVISIFPMLLQGAFDL